MHYAELVATYDLSAATCANSTHQMIWDGHYRVTKDSWYVSFLKILDLAPYRIVKCMEVYMM